MANLIIKSSADNLVLQGSDASPAITVGATGTTTFAENATLSGTANALGTVATANLSNNNIVMPRFKEFATASYATETTTTASAQDALNISGTTYITLTPEHVNDIFEFQVQFTARLQSGYFGLGVQRSTHTNFSTGLANIYASGRHSNGQFGNTGAGADHGQYMSVNNAIHALATGLTPDTPYYFRIVVQIHSTGGTKAFGAEASASVYPNPGITYTGKRWSIV